MEYLKLLYTKEKTCIIFNNNSIIYESTNRGVQPLIDFLTINKRNQRNLVLADRVIGKGAVILAQNIGIKEIHTPVISNDALELAKEYGIACDYITLVPFIQNRDNTGRCPIESCVLDTSDPVQGLSMITQTLQELKKAT